jgi:hypothetical protein
MKTKRESYIIGYYAGLNLRKKNKTLWTMNQKGEFWPTCDRLSFSIGMDDGYFGDKSRIDIILSQNDFEAETTIILT